MGRENVKNIQKNKQNLLVFGGGINPPPSKALKKTLVEMLNLLNKIDQLQKEVGQSFAEMNDSIKSLVQKQYQQL